MYKNTLIFNVCFLIGFGILNISWIGLGMWDPMQVIGIFTFSSMSVLTLLHYKTRKQWIYVLGCVASMYVALIILPMGFTLIVKSFYTAVLISWIVNVQYIIRVAKNKQISK